MKKVIAFLLCVIWLAGCSAEQQTDAPETAEVPTPVMTSAPLVPVTEPTPAPEPEEQPVPETEALMALGKAAILDLIPQQYRADIPMNEIAGADAALNERSCNVTIDWATKKSPKDVAELLSEKLPYTLVMAENEWRNPEGSQEPGIRIKGSEAGAAITYIMPPSMASSTLLTDSFPLENFEDLPESLDPSAAIRSVGYNDVLTIWSFGLSWRFDAQQGKSVADSLLGAYAFKEGYTEEEKNGQVDRSYRISENGTLRFGWMEEDGYSIHVTYDHRMPGHLQSESMQLLLSSGPAILLADLPEAYLDILGSDETSLTYWPSDNLCYSARAEDKEDHPAVAQRAAEAAGAALVENDHGGYNYVGEDFSVTVKFSGGSACWEYEKQAEEGFAHPYLHDLFPVMYLPELPELTEAVPYSMSIGYSKSQDRAHVSMSRAWLFEDEAAIQAVMDALEAELKDYPGFSTDHEILECSVKEYGFSCRITEKNGKWVLETEFNYSA